MAGKIRQAAEDALPAIAARAGARPDWAQDFERQYGRAAARTDGGGGCPARNVPARALMAFMG